MTLGRGSKAKDIQDVICICVSCCIISCLLRVVWFVVNFVKLHFNLFRHYIILILSYNLSQSQQNHPTEEQVN